MAEYKDHFQFTNPLDCRVINRVTRYRLKRRRAIEEAGVGAEGLVEVEAAASRTGNKNLIQKWKKLFVILMKKY